MVTSSHLDCNILPRCYDNPVSHDSFVVEINTKRRYRKELRRIRLGGGGHIELIDDRYEPAESATRFHVPNSLLGHPLLWLKHHIEDELSSTCNFDPRSVRYLTHQIYHYLLRTAVISATWNPEAAVLDLLVEFKISTIELVDEGFGNHDGGVLVFEEEELLMMMTGEEDDEESVMVRRWGASKSAIDGLKKEKFGCAATTTNCVVCLDDISSGTEFTRLLCSHVFHYQCIVQWLEESNNCPICRYEIPD